jgi:3-phenylpropionate/cinnamic acid dioxygenase small subunit
MSRDFCFLNAERLSQVMNTDRGSLHIQAISRDAGIADAGQIWRNYGKALSQDRHDRLPHQRSFSITVQQNQRRPVSSRKVMQLKSVDVCSVRSNYIVRIVRTPVCQSR